MLALGRAREGGIEVEGKAKLLGFTAFEAVAGSGYHRPALHTHTLAGRNLQELQMQAAGVEAAGGPGVGSRTRHAQHAEQEAAAVQLLEDENDDLCHICGLPVSLPATRVCHEYRRLHVAQRLELLRLPAHGSCTCGQCSRFADSKRVASPSQPPPTCLLTVPPAWSLPTHRETWCAASRALQCTTQPACACRPLLKATITAPAAAAPPAARAAAVSRGGCKWRMGVCML